MPRNLIPIPSPIKGINRVMSREQQPDGTCWNALNVVPYDKYGRARVAQRTGLSKLYTTQIGGGRPIQGMIAPANIIYPGQSYGVPWFTLVSLGVPASIAAPNIVYSYGPSPVPNIPSNVNFSNLTFGFTITLSGTVNDSNLVPAGNAAVGIVTVQLSAAPTEYLTFKVILSIFPSGAVGNWPYLAGYTISLTAYKGTTAFSTSTNLGGVTAPVGPVPSPNTYDMPPYTFPQATITGNVAINPNALSNNVVLTVTGQTPTKCSFGTINIPNPTFNLTTELTQTSGATVAGSFGD
jgi:hypothetical protein